jgi:hypothetical protein
MRKRNVINTINECQKINFIKKAGNINLETDASDLGIGAYLYQEDR